MIHNMERQIIVSLTSSELKDLILSNDKSGQHVIVIKFTATWCGPCKTIKHVCDEYNKNLPANVIIAEIDIDHNLDIYMFFKRGSVRVVQGVPTLLAWFPTPDRDNHTWYLPDNSISGGNIPGVIEFYESVKEEALCN